MAMADDNSIAGATTTTGPLSPLIPNLPDDISLQCIARIPRPYHSSLSAVSKSWRSIIRSPEFFNTRSLLRSTQQSLYLGIRVYRSRHWYLLNQNRKNPNLLSPLPFPPLHSQPSGAAFAVLGPKVYVIGGLAGRDLSSGVSNNVWIFDCRFNTWEIGPKMRLGRTSAAAGVVNGKIYVMGGYDMDYKNVNYMDWIEVYDPLIGVWNSISSPVNKWMYKRCFVHDGRIYGSTGDDSVVVYNAVTGEWESSIPKWLDFSFIGRGAVVHGVVYDFKEAEDKIVAYNVERDVWNDLKGVDNNLFRLVFDITMMSLNGNLCVVWHRAKKSWNEEDIMCAEIEVWKDDDGEGFSGSVLWSDVILCVRMSSVEQCIAVDF